MKLHLASGANSLVFTGSGAGYVSVNGQRYSQSLIVTPTSAQPWDVIGPSALNDAAFAKIDGQGFDVVLLGTGRTFVMPDLKILKAWKGTFAARGVGLEVMDTSAACRTYNILCDEGRQVVAAVIVE